LTFFDITSSTLNVSNLDFLRVSTHVTNRLSKLLNRETLTSPNIVWRPWFTVNSCPEIRLYNIVNMNEIPCLCAITVHSKRPTIPCLLKENANHAAVITSGLPRAIDIEIPQRNRRHVVEFRIQLGVLISR
jgi:hypothetical protein